MSKADQAKPYLPVEISTLASERELGALVHAPVGPPPKRGAGAGGFFLAGVIALVAAIALAVLDGLTGFTPFLAIGVFAFAFAVVLPIFGVRLLFSGPRLTYMYEGGLIVIRNSPPRVVVWSDVRELVVRVGGERSFWKGDIVGYVVQTKEGDPIKIGSPSLAGSKGEPAALDVQLPSRVQAAGGRVTKRVG